jgi:hypothetical protein
VKECLLRGRREKFLEVRMATAAAYAKILILRALKSEHEVAAELGDGYVGTVCDPVYPQ